MGDIVSVIIPIYKTKRWLPKCIESVMKQTYTNIEIILVDDGSPDESRSVCEKYAGKDARIKVIHKENGGVSSARNTGIDCASGKYVCFIDSDDWIPRNSIEAIYNKIKETNADFCSGAIRLIYPVHDRKELDTANCVCYKNDIQQLASYMETLDSGILGKLFCHDIIKKNNMKFPIGVSLGEDTVFLYRYMQACNKFAAIDEEIYFYNQLVTSSLSRTYNADMNVLNHRCVIEYAKIFINPNHSIAISLISKQALRRFDLVCRRYVQMLPDAHYDEALGKLRETHILFKQYINTEMMLNDASQQTIHVVQPYLPFLQNEDYGGLYAALHVQDGNPVKRYFKKNIKVLLALIKRTAIFDLKLWYR